MLRDRAGRQAIARYTMPSNRHYPNAPIIEAIIDLRVKLAHETTFEQLLPIKEAIATDYPKSQDLLTGEAHFEFGKNLNVTSTQELIGYGLISKENRFILQARLDGFALSALPSYDRWETFRDEAKRCWEIYRSHLEIEAITRVAVRYINRIDIPFAPAGETVQQEDYFHTFPQVADYAFTDLELFAMQLHIPQPDMESMLILKQARIEAAKPETIAIILDIDLFQDRSQNPWSIEDNSTIWDFFEKLHHRKNDVFEASITDKTRELIQ